MYTDTKTWAEAEKQCQADGGHLYNIRSRDTDTWTRVQPPGAHTLGTRGPGPGSGGAAHGRASSHAAALNTMSALT